MTGGCGSAKKPINQIQSFSLRMRKLIWFGFIAEEPPKEMNEQQEKKNLDFYLIGAVSFHWSCEWWNWFCFPFFWWVKGGLPPLAPPKGRERKQKPIDSWATKHFIMNAVKATNQLISFQSTFNKTNFFVLVEWVEWMKCWGWLNKWGAKAVASAAVSEWNQIKLFFLPPKREEKLIWWNGGIEFVFSFLLFLLNQPNPSNAAQAGRPAFDWIDGWLLFFVGLLGYEPEAPLRDSTPFHKS